MIDYFNSCRRCTPPKRHPGCHATCPEYIEAKKTHDDMKENERIYTENGVLRFTPAYERMIRRHIIKKGK